MKDSSVFVEEATTRIVAAHERADYWSELINSYHRRLGYAFPRDSNFDGRTTLRRTTNYQLIGWESDAVTYYRTAGHVRGDSDDDFRLLLPVNGQANLEQAGERAVLPSGFACLVTLERPFAFSLGADTKGLLMTIPRREIDHRLGRMPDQAATAADLNSGLGRVVADLAAGLFANGGDMTRHQFDTVASHLVELLCMHIVGEQPTAPGHLADVEAVVRRYVRTHAEDPDLTGATIAHALGWSLRQIQLAFQHVGTTPRELIKEERLQLAYSRLRNPVYRESSIADVAMALGFGSASAFSTAFRHRFGATPREVRFG
ncbi:helix-turn-helix domain-containing protein [Nocardia sp. NPDC049190]|uniref:helix-turn-helix domain-containing protein n=1 Tax=Nocardia sp. NPDC049190 TaxID=3155650 RepID=UPI0033EA5AEF